MNEDKGSVESGFGVMDKDDDKKKDQAVSRARNRTVMLTPEMTGQVRSMLQQGQSTNTGGQQSGKRPEYLPPVVDWEGGAGTRPTVDAQRPSDQRSSDHGQGFVRPLQNQQFGSSVVGADSDRTTGNTGKFDPVSTVIGGADQQRTEQRTEQGAGQQRVSQPESASSPTTNFVRPPNQQSFGGGFGQGIQKQPTSRQEISPYSAPPVQAPAQAPVQQVPVQAQPAVASGPRPKLIGFLISYDSGEAGEIYEIRAGRMMLTSKNSDQPDNLVIQDESISPLHAIIRATKEGKIQVLDQLSEYGTGVRHVGAAEEEEVTGNLVGVSHGDVLRFGKRFFVVCCIPPLPATS